MPPKLMKTRMDFSYFRVRSPRLMKRCFGETLLRTCRMFPASGSPGAAHDRRPQAGGQGELGPGSMVGLDTRRSLVFTAHEALMGSIVLKRVAGCEVPPHPALDESGACR